MIAQNKYEVNRFLSFHKKENPNFVRNFAYLAVLGLYYNRPFYSQFGFIQCAFCTFIERLDTNSNPYSTSFKHMCESKEKKNCNKTNNVYISEFQYDLFKKMNIFESYTLLSSIIKHNDMFLYYNFPLTFDNTFPNTYENRCFHCNFDRIIYDTKFLPYDLDWIHAIHSNSLFGCQWLNRKYGKDFCLKVKLWQSGILTNDIDKVSNEKTSISKYYNIFLNFIGKMKFNSFFDKIYIFYSAYKIYRIRNEFLEHEKKENNFSNTTCVICLTNNFNCVVSDCGHLFCKKCITSINSSKCPVCRSIIRDVKNVYF